MRVFLCPFNLDLFPRLPYNIAMKDKELKIKVDDQFIEKVDYLQRINDYKNRSDTVRKVVEKEYRKEKDDTYRGEVITSYPVESGGQIMPIEHYPRSEAYCKACPYLNTLDCRIYGVGLFEKVRCTLDNRK